MQRPTAKFIGALLGGAPGDAAGETAFRCGGCEALLGTIDAAGTLH